MPTNTLALNLKVLLFDSDYYALQAINSYMAWDRRTRVMHYTHDISSFWQYLESVHFAEVPDVVILDGEHLGGASALIQTLRSIHKYAPKAHIICLMQSLDATLAEASAKAQARACLLKGDVQLQITWAVCYVIEQEFTITRSMAAQARQAHHPRLYNAHILPKPRDYPEMTDRIRQAIKLCVIEGMPAHLAADEMGISLHTIRGYIKEGYRILESYDTQEYPADMTPQERAFMRFTALAEEKL